MRDPIGRWYDAGFDRLNVIVPEQTWEAIKKATQDWQAIWLKESQEAITADPKVTNWENLSQSLAAHNNARRMRTRFIYRSTALVAAFILVPWLLSDYSTSLNEINTNRIELSVNSIDEVTTASKVSELSDNLIPEEAKSLNNIYYLSEEFHRPVNQQNSTNSVGLTSMESKNETPLEISELNVSPVSFVHQHATAIELAESRPISSTVTNQETLMDNKSNESASVEVNPLPIRANDPIVFSLNQSLGFGIPGEKMLSFPKPTWMVGVKGNLHANTLLNPMTQMANSGVAGVDNKLSYNLSGGISARKYFGSKNSFEADLMFGETRRQLTDDSRTGNLIHKDISLTYNTLSLIYRRSISPRWKMNEVTVNVGMYGALRSSIQEKWNNQNKLFLSEGYGRTDVGITAGIDYTMVLSRRIRLTTGLKYQLGGVNIFKGLDYMPSDFYQTYTTAFGFTSGLYYCF